MLDGSTSSHRLEDATERELLFEVIEGVKGCERFSTTIMQYIRSFKMTAVHRP